MNFSPIKKASGNPTGLLCSLKDKFNPKFFESGKSFYIDLVVLYLQ